MLEDTNPPVRNVSIVIPVRNQEWTVAPLYRRLCQVADREVADWEFIFVDGKSSDNTLRNLSRLERQDSRISILCLRQNYGLTQALQAGFDYAKGHYVVTVSASLQNDPNDIPVVVSGLDLGYDVVAAKRKKSTDSIHDQRLRHWLNAFISWLSGVRLSDYDCLLRAYRTPDVQRLTLSGDLWRYLPAYLVWRGKTICEIEVTHWPRSDGLNKKESRAKSMFKTTLDLVFLKYLQRYSARPLYLFGSLGLASLAVSALAAIVMLWFWVTGQKSLSETPLPIFVSLTTISGLILVSLGIISEMIGRVQQGLSVDRLYALEEQGSAPNLGTKEG